MRAWTGVVLTLVLVTGLTGAATPALHGDGLFTLLGGLLIAALIVVQVVLGPDGDPAVVVFSLTLGAGSILLMIAQPAGTAVIGVYAAVAGAVIRLPRRLAVAVVVPIIAAVEILILLTASERVLVVAWTSIGFGFMFLLGHLVRVSEDRQSQAQALVEEEKRTRVARTEAAALDERGRIAREMHDVLAHSLSALSVELEGARLLARDRDADPAVVAAIERAHGHAASGLGEARAAIAALRGDAVPGPDRLAELAADFDSDGVDCALEVEGEPHPLSSEASLAIYRTAQEALTNVRKHAHADRVEMRLRYGDDGTSLVVEDSVANGNGRVPLATLAEAGSGYGVSGMRERAELIGGRLAAGPTASGYRVELWIPH
jgi:signal transduction histidine kinase